jgi:hypothetical protein
MNLTTKPTPTAQEVSNHGGQEAKKFISKHFNPVMLMESMPVNSED